MEWLLAAPLAAVVVLRVLAAPLAAVAVLRVLAQDRRSGPRAARAGARPRPALDAARSPSGCTPTGARCAGLGRGALDDSAAARSTVEREGSQALTDGDPDLSGGPPDDHR